MYEELFDDFFKVKSADDSIAEEEENCIFNKMRKENDKIRNHKFDYEEYITSKIKRYLDEDQNVDNVISEIINQIRIDASNQHAEFLTKLNLYNSIMDGSCPTDVAFEHAYEELHGLLSWIDEDGLEELDFSLDQAYDAYLQHIKYIDRTEFREIYFNTNKYKNLLTIPHEIESDYYEYTNRLDRQIRDYMHDRKRFNIYNNLTPGIIELFRSECMHPGTVVFVNGRYKKIHGGWELRKILRKHLPINIRTSEEFKATADKHKHHNRFDTDIDLIEEEA